MKRDNQMRPSTIKRGIRHVAIVTILSNGHLTNAARLSDELQVSDRTIYRDMHQLRRKYPGIIGEAGAGCIMRHGRRART